MFDLFSLLRLLHTFKKAKCLYRHTPINVTRFSMTQFNADLSWQPPLSGLHKWGSTFGFLNSAQSSQLLTKLRLVGNLGQALGITRKLRTVAQYQHNVTEWDVGSWCRWSGVLVGQHYEVGTNSNPGQVKPMTSKFGILGHGAGGLVL